LAQLGSGAGSSFPTAIDSRQIFRNGSSPAPDSDTRIDAELSNDQLAAIIALQTTLGAGVQGTYGSVAARLNQFFPGAAGIPGIISFTNATSLTIPGSQHNVGQAALLWRLYDNQVPAHAIAPGSVSFQISPATYDISLQFASPLTGSLALGIQSPLYVTSFTNATTVSIPGTTHQLPTADILFQVYQTSGAEWVATEPGGLSVDPSNRNVLLTFGVPLTGTLVLSAGGPAYATSFNLTSAPYSFTIPGSTHLLGTPALLFQAYDTGSPRNAMGDPDVSVHPSSFDIVVAFPVPIAGRIVFGAATTLTGRDFDIRDAGIINQSAVRMRSQAGALLLQPGATEHVYFMNKVGNASVVVKTDTYALGLGIEPTHQLHLAFDDAVKPGGGQWSAPSSPELKEDVRPFTDGLATLLALDPISFRYNGKGGVRRSTQRHIGLDAEAARTAAAYLTRGYKGQMEPDTPLVDLLLLDPSPLPYVLINAVKEQQAQIQALQERLTTLEAQVGQLRSSPHEETTP
jgi:hypothetical protein